MREFRASLLAADPPPCILSIFAFVLLTTFCFACELSGELLNKKYPRVSTAIETTTIVTTGIFLSLLFLLIFLFFILFNKYVRDACHYADEQKRPDIFGD